MKGTLHVFSGINFRYVVAIFWLIIFSCQTSKDIHADFGSLKTSKEAPVVAVVNSGTNTGTIDQLKMLTDYTKIPMYVVDEGSYNNYGKLQPSVKVLCVSESFRLSDTAIDSLHTFVAKGGTLFLTSVTSDERLAYLMGLNSKYDFSRNLDSYGYYLNSNFFPRSKGQTHTGVLKAHEGFAQDNFSDGIEILAYASNNHDYPVLYRNKIGNGNVLVHNSKLDFIKSTRGILFPNLLFGLEGVPYPIANVASVQLDEFPAPMAENKNQGSGPNFVADVWWPDMKSLSEKHDLRYTAFTLFDNNENVNPPFDFENWEEEVISDEGKTETLTTKLGKNLLDGEHELAFGGYTNVSLSQKNWGNQDNMVDALNKSMKKWESIDFGRLPISFGNSLSEMDSIGLNHLERHIPSIRYVQGKYFGGTDKHQADEFSPNHLNPYFFDFPRMSEGFSLTLPKRVEVNSAFMFTGIWTHAVNPNNIVRGSQAIMGNESNPGYTKMLWQSNNTNKGLLQTFDEELSAFKQKFPLARFVTAGEGAAIVTKWRYAYYKHLRKEGLYSVFSDDFANDTSHEHHWFVYVDKDNDAAFDSSMDGQALKVVKSDLLNGYLYQIQTPDAFISLPETVNSTNENALMTEMVNQERAIFKGDKLEQLPFVLELEKLMTQGRYPEATGLIENHVTSGRKLTSVQWLTYANLMSDQKRNEELWNFLERDYQLEKNPIKVYNALKIGKEHNYPNLDVHQVWLDRAVENEIGGLATLREYASIVDADRNPKKKKQLLKKIAEQSQLPGDNLDYFRFLLDSNDPELVEILNTTRPCAKDFESISNEITTFLADNFMYDKALEWAECGDGVNQSTQNEWFEKSTNFEELKDTDPLNYYGILMNRYEDRAVAELSVIETCRNTLLPMADKIAVLLGDYGNYRGALSWAECAENIPIKKELKWNYEMNRYTRMSNLYEAYIADNPTDTDIKYYTANLHLNMGNLEAAAAITTTIEKGTRYNELKEALNKNIGYLDTAAQYQLVTAYPELFTEEIKTEVKENNRLTMGNDIFFWTTSNADDFDPTVLTFLGGYNFNDKAKNVHSVAAVRGFVYAIDLASDDPDNLERNLIGLQYGFMNPRGKDVDFRINARIEGDNDNNTFYHLNSSLDYTKDKSRYGARLGYRPVQTGPGYVLDIYNAKLGGSASFQLGEDWIQTTTVEGNYYSDDEFSVVASARLDYALINDEQFKFGPLVETSYGTASTDRRDGFPYWMAENRFTAGPGLGFKIGNPKGDYFIDASASWFYENQDYPSFERYMAALRFKMLKYFDVNTGFQVYTIDDFFLNTFSFGLRYNLKPFKYNF